MWSQNSKKVALKHVYKLKTQKKEICATGDLKKDNNKGGISEKTKNMKFTEKVKRLASHGWNLFTTLIRVKVECSTHYIIFRAQCPEMTMWGLLLKNY